jgi:hypothetical protein
MHTACIACGTPYPSRKCEASLADNVARTISTARTFLPTPRYSPEAVVVPIKALTLESKLWLRAALLCVLGRTWGPGTAH